MNGYIGSIQYCYANSTAMLLQAIGEQVTPSQIEVLTGVGLGAMWMEEAKLIFFGNWTAAPDRGVSQALEVLGFSVIERTGEGESAPLAELRAALEQGPVVMGPLDMGHLTYNPNSQFLFGSDHYVLAYAMEGQEVHLHDPAGFPCVSLATADLERAWRAENIFYRRDTYRYWTAPQRKRVPTEEEIYQRAVEYFKTLYRESEALASEKNLLAGRDAISHVADRARQDMLTPEERGHLGYFAFQLGAKRALDYRAFFQPYDNRLSRIKERQAQLFGRCHTLLITKQNEPLADTLEELGRVEEEFRQVLFES